jgi:YetA-like protein
MPARDIDIVLRANTPARRVAEPVTCGVPFPRGALRDATMLRMVDPNELQIPLQVRVLNAWSDGSVRWVLCDWQATLETEATYRLRIGEAATIPVVPTRSVGELEARKFVEGIGSRWVSSEELILEEFNGTLHEPLPDFDWYVEDAGPVRVCIRERGVLTKDGVHIASYTWRTHHFANSPVVRVHVTVTNPNRADHPGGLWDLGELNSILIRDLAVRFDLYFQKPFAGRLSAEVGGPWIEFNDSLEIYQESSGGENWKSTNHVNRNGEVWHTYRGYLLKAGDNLTSGLRATPILNVLAGDWEVSLALQHFWQNFPKALTVEESEIRLHLLPRQYSDRHELQGGEQKTHVFYVAFGKDSITDEPLDWTRDPITAVVDAEWIASTGAIPYFTSQASDPHRDYQRLANAAVDGNDTFEQKRETIDEYGWRHFGDIYGDHEAVLHAEFGSKPRISHYNNQYDAIAGFAVHWLRSGDVRWFRQMNELASHVRDIDIYNTDEDKAAYNRGLFWHTYHYVDADTGTHRSYPKRGRIPPHGKQVPGGGPGSEQNYAQGLMLHYFLTGDEASKEAAVGLAQWVIDMDDGRITVFGLLCRGDTGLASASRSPDYHGPGRGAANSVSALLDGHQLTGDPKLLRKAEQLIRRVIHPSDDVTLMVGTIRDGKVCVDSENRWFYVMFLQSLGKYLDYKSERAELDEHYAYARASLLHYARWMAEHEYPYLDRAELLEYPTETWAAQDMRKSEVFDFAALHATGQERVQFQERAAFFFRASVERLSSMSTKTLCRPVVLMMTQGWRRAWFASHSHEARPEPVEPIADFGRRVEFVPQKVIAIRRAKRLAVAGAFVASIGIIGIIVWLLA